MELNCINTEDAQEIFRACSIQQRKKILAQILNIPEFDEEDDFKTAILLDIYYDNLAFAVERGFPWNQVCAFFDLVGGLLHDISGKTLSEGITFFKQHALEKSHLFGEENLKSLVDFVFSNIFQHYKLYQYLLTQERSDDITRHHCVVEPPQNEVPLFQDGLPEKEWVELQKLKEIDERERARQKEREEYYEEERRKAQEEVISRLELSDEPLTRERLQKVIQATAAAHTDVIGATIRESLDQTQDSVEYKILRSSIIQERQSSGRRSGASSKGKKKK